MKLLQLNIEGGKRLEAIAKYILQHDYDIVCMQEVTAGERFQIQNKYQKLYDEEKYPSRNCFVELSNRLTDWQGELAKSFSSADEKSFVGNAIFYKKSLKVVNRVVVEMNEQRAVEADESDPTRYPYKALGLDLELDGDEKGRVLHVMTGHFIWSIRPYDTEDSITMAHKVYRYLREQELPFILTGDFNLDYRTVTGSMFEKLGRNLLKGLGITNTLNPNLHRAKHLFPEGVAADHVYATDLVDVSGFRVVKDDLSDHYGLEVEFEVKKEEGMPIGLNLRD